MMISDWAATAASLESGGVELPETGEMEAGLEAFSRSEGEVTLSESLLGREAILPGMATMVLIF
jgi:hypothetical protein